MTDRYYDTVAGEYAHKYGQSTKEIANDLGITPNAVDIILCRALKKLRSYVTIFPELKQHFAELE
jgi:DNA-directed RNA polymerase sigma subunit (sigma70/sigma32)